MAINAIIKLEDLKIGIKLPAPIYDAKKKSLLLLNDGVVLTAQFVDRLRQRGISTISINADFADEVSRGRENRLAKETSAEKPPTKQTIRKIRVFDSHKKCVQRKPILEIKPKASKIAEVRALHHANELVMGTVYQTVKNSSSFSKDQIQAVTNSSLKQIADDIDVFVLESLQSTESAEEHAHALRVSELAMAMATIMKIPEEQVKLLGLGCLLSRSGATKESLELSRSSRKLSSIEMMEIKKNPARTFDIMAKCADLNMITRQVAYQMFERWDGSGYPRARIGVQIHPLARIAGICDVFVAMTTDRKYRKCMTGYSAVREIIKETKNGKFDPAVVRGLLQTISLFPLGSYVRLSNGHIGKVLRNIPENYDRPTLMLLSTLSHGVFELSKHKDIQILDVIDDEIELSNLMVKFPESEYTKELDVQPSTIISPNHDELTVWERENETKRLSHEHQLMFNF